MESEFSAIFRVKLVAKNIVFGSPGTQFMPMRVKTVSKYFSFKYLYFTMMEYFYKTIFLLILIK